MKALLDYICDELDELERKADKDGKLTMQEIEYMDTLAHAKKNLLKAEEMADGEYSMNMGHSYARGRRGNVRRDAMGRYSRAEDDFRMELQDLMHDAPNEQIKQKIQRIMADM